MKSLSSICNTLKRFFWFAILFYTLCGEAQKFTLRDTLQGGIRPERSFYNVLHYDLKVRLSIEEQSILGKNHIAFEVTQPTKRIQIDLFENLAVDSIYLASKIGISKIERLYDAIFIELDKMLPQKKRDTLIIRYSGKPKKAKNAPWDGGMVWRKDTNGNPFVGVAVQGTGASLWYPCKDMQADEPDNGATITIEVPEDLTAVSNGKLISITKTANNYRAWKWQVKNPINNYNITLNVAKYSVIEDKLDDLTLTYYVLDYNKEKAQKHFEEVKPMLACFQEKFGAYPFVEDGYKLVETPYLGMEHQSAVAYGNHYNKGYMGGDLSETGIGLLFDYILIHETGHEWFGNSITSFDIADMWIHEGFTTYSESVYVECRWGYEKAMEYINGQKKRVTNFKPIIGTFGVNHKSGNSDMYYKGALFINTLRHILNNDQQWWALLKKFHQTYRHKIINHQEVISFFCQEMKQDVSAVFRQYLTVAELPKLIIKTSKRKITLHWETKEPNFAMPIEIYTGNTWKRILLSSTPITLELTNKTKFSEANLSVTKFLFTYKID